MIQKLKAVCFTGHRSVKETAELKKALIEQLVKRLAILCCIFQLPF